MVQYLIVYANWSLRFLIILLKLLLNLSEANVFTDTFLEKAGGEFITNFKLVSIREDLQALLLL